MRNTIWAAAALLVLGTTNAAGQDVSYDFDRGTDFSRIKTYAWVRGGTEVADELNHKRIVAAIESQLAAKGLVKVEVNENPDVLIAYHTTFGKDVRIQGFSSGGWGYRYGGRSGSATVHEDVIGTLTISMVDGHTRSLVWKGSATRRVDADASPEKRDKDVNKAAEKLMKNYPPKES